MFVRLYSPFFSSSFVRGLAPFFSSSFVRGLAPFFSDLVPIPTQYSSPAPDFSTRRGNETSKYTTLTSMSTK